MKYEITAETTYHGPVTLHRIKALEDSDNVKKGDLGGYIEKESNLDQAGRAWVSDDAKVYGNAWVSGNARISDMAEVYGNAQLSGQSRVSDDAKVYGNAQLSGQSRVSDDAKVFGDAEIGDGGIVKEKAKISGKVLVGRAIVGGEMEAWGEQTISRGRHDDKTSPYWGDGDGK